jgi:hypothetical protein
MNCAEFERLLPDMLEGVRSPEQQLHLRACPACSELVLDLEVISHEARGLQACDEPSPRVWNSIEIALRQEGLIHQPRGQSVAARSRPRWTLLWLMPAAAALLFAFGIVTYRQGTAPAPAIVAQHAAPASVVPSVVTATVTASPAASSSAVANMPKDDLQLLEAVGARSPALRDMYAADLQNVNEYIHDAEESARNNPNDEEAQRYLVNAYEQKTMVYEIALDRSLP